jgi:hypothetical protein
MWLLEANIGIGDPPPGQDCSRLNGEERGTRERELTQMDQVPVGHASILGRVLAHGRDHDATGEFELSHPERCE